MSPLEEFMAGKFSGFKSQEFIAAQTEIRRLQKMEEIINGFIDYAREGESGYNMDHDYFWNLKELLK
jgi:hypothetical protein